MKKATITLILLVLCFATTFGQDTLFVKNSGTSTAWSGRNAYTELQEAIDAATAGDVIWVAEGTYYPTTTFDGGNDNRCKSFLLKDSVILYGGFVGTETSIDEREKGNAAWEFVHASILSGDISHTPDVATDNSYHVVYGIGTSYAILDGFTVSDGYANRIAYEQDGNGGGVYLGAYGELLNCIISNNYASKNGGGAMVSATGILSNCLFSQNTVIASNSGGGAAYFDNRGYVQTTCAENCFFEYNHCAATSSSTSLRIGGGAINAGQNSIFSRCTFFRNSCTNPGGAVYCTSSDAFNFCIFTCNEGKSGGAVYCNGASLLTSNCQFSNNAANINGGAIYSTGSSCRAVNCTFANNLAATGCAIYGSSAFTLFNGIVWNNGSTPNNQVCGATDVTCKYTAIQGVLASGTGNLNVTTDDIQFLAPYDSIGIPEDESECAAILLADYSLYGSSVCKNAGNTSTIYLSGYQFPSEDLGNNPRIVGSHIDLGCYENQCDETAPEVVWTALDTIYSDTFPGTGTVTLLFTLPNPSANNEYYISFDNGETAIPMPLEGITYEMAVPGTLPVIVTAMDTAQGCSNVAEISVTIDSVFVPTAIKENAESAINVFPNPAHDFITIQYEKENSNAMVELLDIFGRTILRQELSESNTTINTNGLAKGTYLLRIIDGKKPMQNLRIIHN